MTRNTVFVLVVSLALAGLAARSEADLGCAAGPPMSPFPPAYSTCTLAADCAPVGGIDCTSDICYCPTGNLNGFCACLATGPKQGAPLLTSTGLIGTVGVLCALGLFGVWRRAGGRCESA